METRAAILWNQPGEWEVTDAELDGPGRGEVLVEFAATGVCHSDDHYATGDTVAQVLPLCGGHEGAGIVREVGPGVLGLAPGDHIVTSFIAACGVCRSCASGNQHLCDNGALMGTAARLDGTHRMRAKGQDVGSMVMLGTFTRWQVLDELCCVKIDKSIPLDAACLVACGVPTGWGSATNAARVTSGDVVVVVGTGGVGIHAVQGAAHSGAARVVAVDPHPLKRETALQVGATDAFADLGEAVELVRHLTNGQGANSVIITASVMAPRLLSSALDAIGKAGTVVVTSLGNGRDRSVEMSLVDLVVYQKRIQGCVYGNGSPRQQIPVLLDLYRAGALVLDPLITKRYTLEDVNVAADDLRNGRLMRGVIEYPALTAG